MKSAVALYAALFLSSALFAAPPDCATCHNAQARKFAETPMKGALAAGPAASILRQHAALEFTEGPYRYRIARQGEISVLTVSDGKREISRPILWAFGNGKAGQTYIIEHDGARYESRVSFFRARGRLGLTIGSTPGVPGSLEEALGHKLTPSETNRCFGCHSTPSPAAAVRVIEGALAPGLQCVSCHTGAEKHAANPAQRPVSFQGYTAEETSELCGKCHRTWADIAAKGPFGVSNVRFQPYRLANAKCYDPRDRRIACTACHDAHGVDHDIAARTDAACKSCHAAGEKARTQRVCSKADRDCATCHMPRYEIENSNHRFPDHQIRIVRPGEPYPD